VSAPTTPSPTLLRDDPELAILAALDHTLRLAIDALVAIYPELTDPEPPPWRCETTPEGLAADHLIARGHALQQAIAAYRAVLLDAREAQLHRELPF